MDALAWNDVVNEFKKRYEGGGYLEKLMQKYLMNDRSMTFTMVGSPTYNRDLEEIEVARKNEKVSELSAKLGSIELAIDQLKKEEDALLNVQEAAQNADVSCLPTLHVADISREKEKKPVRESKIDGVEVVWREAPTNGLSYIQAVNGFDDLPDDLRLLLPLFSECILRLGTAGRSMEQWEDLIKLKTGGISSSPFIVSSPTDLSKFTEGLQFSGYALDKNVSTMLEMLSALVTETDFTSPAAPKMIQELLRSTTNGALDAVAARGHRYAVNVAASSLSRKFWIQEQQSGLAQIQAMAHLFHDAESSPDQLQELIQKLQLIQSFAISKSRRFRVRIVCEPEGASENEAILQRWLDSLPHNVSPPATGYLPDSGSPASKVFYDLPYQVSYSGLALQTVPFVDRSSAPLSVLSQLLTHKYLHPEIREKGGAYGAGASSGPVQGMFSLSSYRDPNPMNSLAVFNNCGLFARERSWTQRELDEAKLGIFQSLDAPMSVDEEGMRYFMSGVTEAMDQRWREQVLDVNTKNVNEVAQKFLVDGSRQGLCILSENKTWPNLDGWDIRKLAIEPPQEEIPPGSVAQDVASAA
jgi:Zn-dependent M16 (insulinase) family peptidase